MQAGSAAEFIDDDWQQTEGGGGRSRVLQNGEVIEKGRGDVLPSILVNSPLLQQSVIHKSQARKHKRWAYL